MNGFMVKALTVIQEIRVQFPILLQTPWASHLRIPTLQIKTHGIGSAGSSSVDLPPQAGAWPLRLSRIDWSQSPDFSLSPYICTAFF